MSVEIIFFGHSTFGITTNDTKILIDPFFTDNPQATVSADDVEADVILISHGHGDHIGDVVSIAKRTGALVIANYEIVGWLGGQGLENLHPLHIGGGNQFPFGRCKMTIAHHGSALPDGSYGGNPGGFLLTLNDGTVIYYAGDTALTYDMKWLADDNVDVAILPIGDNFTMGPDDAMKAIKLIQPKVVLPCHYGTWPYIDVDAEAFAKRCITESDSGCVLLSAGNTYSVS